MKRSNARLRFLYIVFGLFTLAIVVNVVIVTLFHLHLRSFTSLDDYIYSVSNVEEEIYASRGTIYDASGSVVGKDVKTYDIICYLDENRLSSGSEIAYVDNPSYTARALAPILKMDAEQIYDILTSNDDLYQIELGSAGRNLSQEQVDQILAIENLHGIDFRVSHERYYPYGEKFAPQIVGFAQSDNTGKLIGKLGVEAYLNDELSGSDGHHSYQIDKHGYVLPGMYDKTIEAIDGYDVYLTLDVSIQDALNTCLQETMEYKNASRAWGAVVEIDTGKILAWSQTPSFNPNEPKSDDVEVNYGSQLAYEPGSVMKAVIYSAAIDLGVYDGEALFDSSPYCYTDDTSRTYNGDQLGCIYNVSKLDWGYIPLDYGLIYSSNVATATLLSKYVGVNNYGEYLKKFHLYETVKTDGIDEISGYTNWGLSPVDDITASYGQGSSLTMLQILQAYTAIFGNGEMLKPYIIDKIVDPNSNNIIFEGTRNVVSTPIKQSTALQMHDLLRRVVSDPEGTCRHYEAKTVGVMGKTGTAEISINGEYSESENIISCMLGFPYEDPKYMVYYAYISPETVYFNYDKKPVPDLIDTIALLEGLNVPEETYQAEHSIYKYEMEDYVGKSIEIALDMLEEKNIEVIVIGDGKTVTGQSIRQGQDVYTFEKVFLLTDGENITVPDFKDYTRKEIISYWNLSGLPFVLDGYGIAYAQSIEPHTTYDGKSEILINFRPIDYIEPIVDEIKE